MKLNLSRIITPLVLVASFLALSACGGGGGGGGGPQYSISLSQSSVSLSAVTGAESLAQTVTVTFKGDGVIVGTLPGQTLPSWLYVSAPSQSASPANVVISYSGLGNVAPGNYSTTLRFVTGKGDGSNIVTADLTVTLQLVAGQQIYADSYGLANGSTVAARLNNGPPKNLITDQLNRLGVLAVGSNYTVNIPVQPPGQTCTFPDGGSTTAGVLGSTILQLRVTCNASLIPWTWFGGTKTSGDAAIHGTRGVPSIGNTPGGRLSSAYAADASGNLWLFGGTDNSGSRSDLWRYDIAARMWTWVSGPNSIGAGGVYGTLNQASANNAPGARYGAAAWIDANGRFWLFGGVGTGSGNSGAGWLNDLWIYDAASDMWTWVGGGNTIDLGSLGTYGTTPSTTNIPGGRIDATVAKDAAGNVWIFGGYGAGDANAFAYMNDLWKFTPSTRVWSWMSGSNMPNSSSATGTRGVPAASNHPGARKGAVLWVDNVDNIWMWGGSGGFASMASNDLWRYDTNNMWTWIGGTDPTSNFVATGQYNPPSVANNIPSGRISATGWTDAAGNLWLFGGGYSYLGTTNDLWKYSPATNSWFWLSGSNAGGSPSVYGTQGVASATNVPSGRLSSVAWIDASGRFWLWGGTPGGSAAALNDFWQVTPQ